ncbi:MAG: peptidoglycan DD-metalloendopeptidase family protein [Armatimonadetes bacterium]|nr:peptidoglycan DD-metalloendopeptidase family protein [Armatimonadota bacterium]
MKAIRSALLVCLALMVAGWGVAPPAQARGSRKSGSLWSRLRQTQREKFAVQRKLRQVKHTQQQVKNELIEAQQKLEAARARLAAARARLRATRARLSRVKSELAVTEARLAAHRKAVALRLRMLHCACPPSLAAVAVGAMDYTDLVDRMRFVRLIAQQDEGLLTRLVQYERKRAQERAELQRLEAERAREHAQVQAETQAVAAEEQRTRQVLQSIMADRQRLEAELAALEAESKRIEQMLAALQRSRHGLRYAGRWSGRLLRPVPGPVCSGFGMRYHPILHYYRMHTGVDISAGYGTPIRAAADGMVVFSGWRGGYGQCVIIDHGSGIATLYAHMSRISVGSGQVVRAGQIIGRVGSTGLSTGPHLHFEVRRYGTPIDPLAF